jgi:DHA1 family multidrug resistance protein B-like MFS transporter
MKFRDFHPNIRIRIIIQFFSGLMSIMVLPLMAIYFAERVGATLTGILLFTTVVIGVISGFFGGYYADRIGRKKLMVVAEVGIMVSYAVAALCNSPLFHSVWLTYIAIIGINIFWGIFAPSSDAMVLDVSKPEERKYIYSIQYWSNNLSSAIGGLIGAFLFKEHLFELLLSLTAMGVLTTLATLFFIKETFVRSVSKEGEEQRSGWRDIFHSYGSVLKDRVFLVFVIASMLLVSVEFHLGNYISVRLAASMPVQGLFTWFGEVVRVDGLKTIGILRTENTLLVVLFGVAARVLFSRMKDTFVLYFGLAIYIIGYSFIAYSSNAWLLFIAMLVATLGEVMYVPVKQAFLGDIPPKHARSTYMALFGFNYRGAWMLASIAVVLGGVFPPAVMAGLIFACGTLGLVQLFVINGELKKRRATAE